MAITASTSSAPKDPIPAGNYVARCYQQIEIGTVTEEYQGETKVQKKVRIGWEFPTELKVFKAELGEQPLVISREYTLSMHEKSNLRKTLKSWRGKDFTDEEAHAFDITKLIGATCMLNITHKEVKGNTYAEISGVSVVPKGLTVPPAVNKPFVLEYDSWNQEKFDSLPDFIKDKMKGTPEYKAVMGTPVIKAATFNDLHQVAASNAALTGSDLPF